MEPPDPTEEDRPDVDGTPVPPALQDPDAPGNFLDDEQAPEVPEPNEPA